MQNLTRVEKLEAIQLLEEGSRRADMTRYLSVYNSFYDWQFEFVAATKIYHETCLCAANQIGKTYLGTDIDAMHLLGEYPDDWPGHKFNFAPLCWGLGYSMEKTRDLLQKALFGELLNGKFSGGLVPADRILSHESVAGTANACRTVRVKHVMGIAQIQFWSYSQGHHAIMGDVIDHVHIDEEPRDQNIRPQVLTRTINGDKGRGGRIIYTFTPENGRTDLVIKFMDNPSKDQFFMKKGWNDAPHMTEEKKVRLSAQYPKHQLKMRTEGEPMLGHGRIYDIADEFITCTPFEIPAHWYVIDGMDFGWDHPQSQVQLVEDRDTGTFYITKAWKAREQSANNAWGATKAWSDNVPTAWPHDGLQNEKGRDDAVQQKVHYHTAGFKMLPEHATWPPVPDPNKPGVMKTGGLSVEHGLYEINDLQSKGKWKVFEGCHEYMDEHRQYHRDEKGKIVKVMDDILDGARYAYMMRRFSTRVGDVSAPSNVVRMPTPIKPMGRR